MNTLTFLLQSFDHLLGEKEKTLQYTHWQTVCEGQISSVLQTKAASPCWQRAKAEQSAWTKWNLVSEPVGWETTRMPHTTCHYKAFFYVQYGLTTPCYLQLFLTQHLFGIRCWPFYHVLENCNVKIFSLEPKIW